MTLRFRLADLAVLHISEHRMRTYMMYTHCEHIMPHCVVSFHSTLPGCHFLEVLVGPALEAMPSNTGLHRISWEEDSYISSRACAEQSEVVRGGMRDKSLIISMSRSSGTSFAPFRRSQQD